MSVLGTSKAGAPAADDEKAAYDEKEADDEKAADDEKMADDEKAADAHLACMGDQPQSCGLSLKFGLSFFSYP